MYHRYDWFSELLMNSTSIFFLCFIITIICSPTVPDSMKYSWTVFSLIESERQTSNSEGCLFFILIQTSSGNLLLGHLKAGFPFGHNCHIFLDCFYLSTQVTIILSPNHFIIRFYETLSKHNLSCKKRPKVQDFFSSKVGHPLSDQNLCILSEKRMIAVWYWNGHLKLCMILDGWQNQRLSISILQIQNWLSLSLTVYHIGLSGNNLKFNSDK